MIDHTPAIPLALALPLGILAEYVAGSDPPQYTVDGELTAIDVRIPEDLRALGWHWYGSYLHVAGDYPVLVATNTYPPPGWPCDQRDCFTVARTFDLSPLAPIAVATPKQAPAPAQLMMEF